MVCKGVVVPAFGTAPPVGRPLPALAPVANRPILCHVLWALHAAGVREAALVLAADAVDAARACLAADCPQDLSAVFIPYAADGLEQALEQAARFVGEAPCIVHEQDGLLTQPLAPLVALLREDAPDLLVAMVARTGEADSVGLATRRLLRLADIAAIERAVEPAGVCLFGPGALRRAAGAGSYRERELNLGALAELLIAGGGRLRIERVRGWLRYTGAAADLLELNRLALDALGEGAVPDSARGGENRIEGAVTIDPSASVRASVIVGPAILGAGVAIVESYIGPYTSIGAGVHVEGAEIERSIVMPGASIVHIGGRLTASVVGRDVRVYRDFSLPRGLRLIVGDGGEVALC
jgi:glucose-1-phosphate thymidylyltransferase